MIETSNVIGEKLLFKDAEEIQRVRTAVPPQFHSLIPSIAKTWNLYGAKGKLKLCHNLQAKKLAQGKSDNNIVMCCMRDLEKHGCA